MPITFSIAPQRKARPARKAKKAKKRGGALVSQPISGVHSMGGRRGAGSKPLQAQVYSLTAPLSRPIRF